jgi:RNA-binding motif X-linked protein 2
MHCKSTGRGTKADGARFGEVIDVNMPRDQETHKPKGFAFVMYEDQRSTVLAVDNMNGAQVLGRTIRVGLCVPVLDV